MKIFSALFYYGIVIPFSSLPSRVLYLISDLVFILIYHIVRYRRKVVMQNLQNSFPTHSKKENQVIAKKFYRQFCDTLIEGIKGLTMSREDIHSRMFNRNPELINNYFDQGKSVIITTGHYYSWEWWFLGIDTPVKHKIVLIYKELSNRYLENKLKHIRSSFGVLPLPFQEVRTFFKDRENGSYGYVFGSDQAPHNAKKAYWTWFLNQETPVAFGAEKFAVEKDIPVVFCRIYKIRRGYYEFEYVDIESNPTATQYGDITAKYTAILEETIAKDPVGWLWTHKRWKREKPEGMKVHGKPNLV